uniref:Evasin n=1 Tax=Amblyomma triste TaxID=251400 RepID=A0A023G4A3_AMBTT
MRIAGCLIFSFFATLSSCRTEVVQTLPLKARIPGCGDVQISGGELTSSATNTTAATTASTSTTPNVEYTDEEECTHKVLGSWFEEGEMTNKQARERKKRGLSNRRVLRTTSCHKICNNTVKALPEGHMCLVVNGHPYGRRGNIRGGCFLGVCRSGLCVHVNEKVSCYIPSNDTTVKPFYVTPENKNAGSTCQSLYTVLFTQKK